MGKKHVMIELRCPKTLTTKEEWKVYADKYMKGVAGLYYDSSYGPIPVRYRKFPEIEAKNFNPAKERLIVVRGIIDESTIPNFEQQHFVIKIWSDPVIKHLCFPCGTPAVAPPCGPPASGAPCNSTCFTGPYTPVSTIDEVIESLNAKWFWAQGITGENIVIGIVDTGLKQCYLGDKIKRKPGGEIDGFPETPVPDIPPPGADWGVHRHGSMVAYDALSISPGAEVLDIGIQKYPGTFEDRLSIALEAYLWVWKRIETGTGTVPHILNNSWALKDKAAAEEYATDPTHPFTDMVDCIMSKGVIVCFAAGNCGALEPDGLCGNFVGEGNSIWGVNALQSVVTVGAAVLPDRWWGGSSQGPGPRDLGYEKPDIVAPSAFSGLTYSDPGTSAACGIVAGVIGLLIDAAKNLPPDRYKWAPTQDEILKALRDSATSLCEPGYNRQTGFGMVNPVEAFVKLMAQRGLDRNDPSFPQPSTTALASISMERMRISGSSYTCPPCIIATAALGSPIHPQIEFLRDYRDDYIIRSRFAYSFNRLLDLYYKFSPSIATKMQQSTVLKNAIKAAIVYPFIGILKGLVLFREFFREIKRKIFG